MKKFKIILFLLLSLVIAMAPVGAVTQEEISKQYSQIEDLKKGIAEDDSQINAQETQINSLNTEINQTNQKLLTAQQEEAELREACEERIKAAYMYGTEGYINYLFSAESPSDFISYYDVAKDILTADKDNLDQLKDKKQQIEDLQKKLTDDRNNLVAAKKQSESAKAKKEQTLADNQELVRELEKQLNEEEQKKTSSSSSNKTGSTPTVKVDDNTANSVKAQSSTPSVIVSTNQQNQAQAQSTQQNDQAQAQGTGESQEETVTTTTTTTTVTEEVVEYDDQGNVIASEVAPVETYTQTTEDTQDNGASSAMTFPRFISEIIGSDTLTDSTSSDSGIVEIPNSSGNTTAVASSDLPGVWYWPLDANDPNAFTITSLMGTRESPGGIGSTNHGGTDIGASYGTAILAAQSGTVELSGEYGGYGNAVMINHNNGYKTLYGHMSSVAVSEGEQVQAGQIIGFVGSTGWSTGPHLHFEVRYTDSAGNESKINGLSLYGQDVYDRLTYSL